MARLAALVLLLVACLAGSAGAHYRPPSSGVAISDRTVLLPQTSSKSRVPFSLRAFNGCFKWSVLHPKIGRRLLTVCAGPIRIPTTCK